MCNVVKTMTDIQMEYGLGSKGQLCWNPISVVWDQRVSQTGTPLVWFGIKGSAKLEYHKCVLESKSQPSWNHTSVVWDKRVSQAGTIQV